MFSVEFGSDAKKFLKRAEKKVAERIISRIEKLKEEPFPRELLVKKIKYSEFVLETIEFNTAFFMKGTSYFFRY